MTQKSFQNEKTTEAYFLDCLEIGFNAVICLFLMCYTEMKVNLHLSLLYKQKYNVK